MHYEGVGDAKCKVVRNIKEPNQYGVYEAVIEVNGKNKISSFFPKDWTPQQVIDAIQEAFDNCKLMDGKAYKYTGYASNGMEIQMYIQNNVITSAFPIY